MPGLPDGQSSYDSNFSLGGTGKPNGFRRVNDQAMCCQTLKNLKQVGHVLFLQATGHQDII